MAPVLFEDRQVALRRQLAVQFPARDVLAAGHEVEDVVGEELEPLFELALVEQPRFADAVSSSHSACRGVSATAWAAGDAAAPGKRFFVFIARRRLSRLPIESTS